MAFLETFGLVTYASMGGWHAAVTKGLTPARQAGTRFTYPGGMEGRVDLGCLLDSGPNGNRTHNHLIASPTP